MKVLTNWTDIVDQVRERRLNAIRQKQVPRNLNTYEYPVWNADGSACSPEPSSGLRTAVKPTLARSNLMECSPEPSTAAAAAARRALRGALREAYHIDYSNQPIGLIINIYEFNSLSKVSRAVSLVKNPESGFIFLKIIFLLNNPGKREKKDKISTRLE